MKILFTGGGTGGHFYPIIAIAQALHEIVRERKLLEPELYFVAPEPFDDRALFEESITFKPSPAGKVRRYFSLLNFTDGIVTFFGTIQAIFQTFSIYPDVIFSKGGYGSVPTLIAAKILGIPVIIHESDTVPGRATRFAATFAKKIAISYEDTLAEFPEKLRDKIAFTGNPVRKELTAPSKEGAAEFLGLEPGIPVLFVIGGSLGAQAINEVLMQALPDLLDKYQVIHQTGKDHIKEVQGTAQVILEKHPHRNRYKPFDYLNTLAMRMSAGAADLVLSRAGSGAISEIALWGKPAILVPIPETISHDQRTNAFAYARTGAAQVIEQPNFASHLLVSEIDRLINDAQLIAKMSAAAKKYSRPDAARVLAEAIVETALEHDK